MNYLKYSSVILILLFLSLIFINSSFATSPELEVNDLDSNLDIIDQNDSINIQDTLKDFNSLNAQDLNESISKSDYSGSINSVQAVSGNTFADIQNAINNAKNGDTIILNNITYFGKGSFIYVDKSVNIIGNTARLNANGLSSIMEVTAPNVNLTNIRFMNGYSEDSWRPGALSLTQSSKYCTVSSCVFINNTAHQGAVFVSSKYSKFLKCNFSENRGIIIKDGIIYTNTARMSGGLNLNNSAAYGYISDCIFRANVGRAGGGASLRGDYNVIQNCIFRSNSVNEGTSDVSYAGALHVGPNNGSKSSASVLNCQFINNSVHNKLHYGHAGALCFEDGSIMENCTFKDNYCEGVGGATTLHGAGVISNCRFINCTATISGGAISTDLEGIEDWTANFTNCYFSGNVAPEGGAVSAMGDGINFYNSTFIDNMAVTGGAIYVRGNHPLFNNIIALNNSADKGGAFYVEGKSASIENTQLEGNSAIMGGAIIIIGNNSNFNKINISYNNANYGGGIYISGSNNLLSNIIFNNNQAIPSKDTPYNDTHMNDGLGGGAFINGKNSTITNTVFSFNSARNGSGIYLSGSQMNFINVSTGGDNKAWSYLLPLDMVLNSNGTITFNITHYGGNNINGGNQSTNYIYLNTSNKELVMDGLTPKNNAENSNNGTDLFKDSREQYQNITVYIFDDEGRICMNFSGITDLYGFFTGNVDISSLNPNVLYTVNFTHEDDTFYTYISNSSSFTIAEPLVNKVANKEFVFKEDIINYNLTIENIAPLEANFLVTDIIPEYFVYQGTNLTPIYEYDSITHKIIWNITLPSQSTCVISIWGYSNKSNVNLTNILEVYNPDAKLSVNTNNTVIVLPEANLNISILPDKEEVNKGSNITLTIDVINNGPDSAHDLVINDLFDSNLIEFIDCNDSRFDPTTGELSLDILEPNETFSFNISFNVIESNTVIDSLANIYSPTNNSNHIPNNCSANASVLVLPQANLILNISADVHDVNIGDIVCWVVNLTNIGPDIAKDVVILDILDLDNLEYVTCNDSRFDIEFNTLNIGDMNPNDTIIFEVYTEIITSGVNITDLVNVYSPTNNSDFVANNISVNDTVNSRPVVDIQVNKSSNLERVNVGDEIIWTINLINNGLNTAHDVYAIDKIPHDLKFLYSKTNVGTYDSVSGVWLIGDVDPNFLCTLSIVTQCIKSGNITNVILTYLNDSFNEKVIMANHSIEVFDVPVFDDGSNVNNSKISSDFINNIPMENSGNPLALIIFSLIILVGSNLRYKF